MKTLASMAVNKQHLGKNAISIKPIDQKREWINPPLVLVKPRVGKKPSDSADDEQSVFVLGYN